MNIFSLKSLRNGIRLEELADQQGHIHNNKTVLDLVTQEKVDKWDNGSNSHLTGVIYITASGTDDTSAIQSAVNDAVTNHKTIVFDSGKIYYLTDEIIISPGSWWVLDGNNCKIVQKTNNKAIFHLQIQGDGGTEATKGSDHFTIKGFSFDWLTKQTGHTNSFGILFESITSGNYGFYIFQINNCRFANGYGGIGILSQDWYTPIWDGHYADLCFDITMVKYGIDLYSNTWGGMPNNRFENLEFGYNQTTFIPLRLKNQDSCHIGNVELNSPTPIYIYDSLNIDIDVIRFESSTINVNTNDFAVINLNNVTGIKINNIEILNVDYTVTDWSYIVKVTGISSLEIGNVRMSQCTISGNVAVLSSGSPAKITGFVNKQPEVKLLRTDDGTRISTFLDHLNRKGVSVNRGDNDITLTAQDAYEQRFESALTTDRTVMLPDALTCDEICNGTKFKIVRTGNGTGKLTVNGFQLSGQSWIEFTFNGTKWIMTGYSSLADMSAFIIVPPTNLTNYDPITWSQWDKAYTVAADSTGAGIPMDSVFSSMSIPVSVKTSTKYGLLMNVVSNGLTGGELIDIDDKLTGSWVQVITPSTAVGVLRLIITTQASITNSVFNLTQAASSTSGNMVKIKNIRLFELPSGSDIEKDFDNGVSGATNLTLAQLDEKYPF